MSIQVLKAELQKLSISEKTEITHFLVELLANETSNMLGDWKDEITRREKALENGSSKGRLASTVINKYYQ